MLGFHRGGLALARALGRAGVEVIGVGAYPADGYRSRYFRERYTPPTNRDGTVDEFVLDRLAKLARARGRLVLFPDNDDGVSFVLDHWDDVHAVADVPLPDDPDVVAALRRKDILPAVAERAGVPAPRTVAAAGEDAILSSGLCPPVLVKPVEGKRFVHLFGEKAFTAASLEEAVAGWRRAREREIDTVVQEVVPDVVGSIYSLYAYLDRNGEPLGAVTGRKVRELPPSIGSSTVFQAGWDEPVFDLGVRLLRTAGYRGLAHVEFARSPGSGALWLIEVNTRIPVWGSIAAGRRSNLPLLAYDDLCGHPPPREAQILRDASCWIDMLEDVDRLRRVPIGPRELLTPYLRRPRARALYAPDDPLPGLLGGGRYLRERTITGPVTAARRWLRTRTAVRRLRSAIATAAGRSPAGAPGSPPESLSDPHDQAPA